MAQKAAASRPSLPIISAFLVLHAMVNLGNDRPIAPQAGWLRLNMGAIHFSQQDYVAAAKQWRMALDLTPPAYRRMRLNTQVSGLG